MKITTEKNKYKITKSHEYSISPTIESNTGKFQLEEPGVYVISGAHLQDSVVDRLEVKDNDKNSGKDVNKKSGPTEVEQSWSNQSGMDSLPDPHVGGQCGDDPGRIDKGTIEFGSSKSHKSN